MNNLIHSLASIPPLEAVQREIDRRECKESLACFARKCWHILEPSSDLRWGWALDAICEHLEAVSSGEIKSLLINVPPGMMKSLLVGVMFPAWEWGAKGKPHLRYLGTSHKQDLATRDNLKCRRLVQSIWYQDRWPIKLTSDQNAKTKFENDKSGFREAMAFTSMTGSRGDRIILDDPLSVDDASSPAAIRAAEITFTESLTTRVNDDNSAKIVVMQRLHENDTSGIILSKHLGYEHLMLPMEFEPDRKCITKIGFKDPREKEGELLFPERFSKDQVDDMKSTMGSYASASQLQQRPAPRGGGLFKKSWFDIIHAAPVGIKWVRGWDLAASEGKDSAYTVGVKMGRTQDGRIIISDVCRIQGSAHEVERLIVNTAAQDGLYCEISIPQDPGQAGKVQVAYFAKSLAGYVLKTSPESGDKETRAQPFAAQAEAGNVSLVVGEWNNAFLDELSIFPNGKFKDQVDASTRAFSHIIQKRTAQAPRLSFL